MNKIIVLLFLTLFTTLQTPAQTQIQIDPISLGCNLISEENAKEIKSYIDYYNLRLIEETPTNLVCTTNNGTSTFHFLFSDSGILKSIEITGNFSKKEIKKQLLSRSYTQVKSASLSKQYPNSTIYEKGSSFHLSKTLCIVEKQAKSKVIFCKVKNPIRY